MYRQSGKMREIERVRTVLRFPPIDAWTELEDTEMASLMELSGLEGLEVPLREAKPVDEATVRVWADTKMTSKTHLSSLVVPGKWLHEYSPFHATLAIPETIEKLPLRVPAGCRDAVEVLGKEGKAVVRQLYADGTCEAVFRDEPDKKYAVYIHWASRLDSPLKAATDSKRIASKLSTWFRNIRGLVKRLFQKRR